MTGEARSAARIQRDPIESRATERVNAPGASESCSAAPTSPEHPAAQGEFCPTCGSALAYDKSGHILYGGRLSYRDFEQILLSLGASGSDVCRLWPDETPKDDFPRRLGRAYKRGFRAAFRLRGSHDAA